MGGCCCSSRKTRLHGRPVSYYQCPPPLEENESLESQGSGFLALAAGLLVNLETSVPDTFLAPPPPLPYDVLIGFPPTESESLRNTLDDSSIKTLATCEDFNGPNCKAPVNSLSLQAKFEISKSNEQVIATTEEEDVCPICLEEYDLENPKIIAKCEHHFHLSCILEWLERSDACPMCDQEVVFDPDF